MKTIVLLGASKNPERYSYKAIQALKEKNFSIIPVHPTEKCIAGLPVVPTLDDIREKVDIISLYVRPEIGETLLGHIGDIRPGLVILNPGSESPKMEMGLERLCIPYHKGCTILLAKNDQL